MPIDDGIKIAYPATLPHEITFIRHPGLTRDLLDFTQKYPERIRRVFPTVMSAKDIDKRAELANPIGIMPYAPPNIGEDTDSDMRLRVAFSDLFARRLSSLDAVCLMGMITVLGAKGDSLIVTPSQARVATIPIIPCANRKGVRSSAAMNSVAGIIWPGWKGSNDFRLRLYTGLTWRRQHEPITDPIFPFMPNWRDGIVESIEYLTDVLIAYDQTEQRICIRDEPRRSYEYSFTALDQSEMALLESYIWKYQGCKLWLPLWMDARQTTHVFQVGDTQAHMEAGRWIYLKEDGYIVLYQDKSNWEIKRVRNIYASALSFSAAAEQSWPKGTMVIPVMLAIPSGKISGQKPTSGLLEMSIQFELAVDADE